MQGDSPVRGGSSNHSNPPPPLDPQLISALASSASCQESYTILALLCQNVQTDLIGCIKYLHQW